MSHAHTFPRPKGLAQKNICVYSNTDPLPWKQFYFFLVKLPTSSSRAQPSKFPIQFPHGNSVPITYYVLSLSICNNMIYDLCTLYEHNWLHIILLLLLCFSLNRNLNVAEDNDLGDKAGDDDGDIVSGLHCKIVVQFERYKDFYNALKVLCGRSLQKVNI